MEGLDINLSEAPPSAWLAPHIKFRQFDVFADLADEYRERYDLINVQYISLLLTDERFPKLLAQFLHMLSKTPSLLLS